MRHLATAIRRSIRAALAVARPLGYATLNGHIGTLLADGRLIRTGNLLDRLGTQLPDGQQSWYGRHVAKAYRARTGREPLRAWVQHRTTGRWIHVCVYCPTDPALYAALRTYKATRHLAAATFTLAA